MFSAETYIARRKRLAEQIGSGLVLLLGNELSPMNYADNPFPFRQDSSFLYFFGLAEPGLAGVIDADERTECVFGDDPSADEIIWTGPRPALSRRCEQVGARRSAPAARLAEVVAKAVQKGRRIHFLPQYRPENVLKIHRLLAIPVDEVSGRVSVELIKAVVAQRSIKVAEEVAEIEIALDIAHEMQTTAMKLTRPGIREREVAAAMEAIALARGGRLSFPTIFSVRGEVLHNHSHENIMSDGEIAVNDCGAESAAGYASDITRTICVGGKFTTRQKEIYSIVYEAQQRAIGAAKPGVEFRLVHRLAARALVGGLKELGLVTGDPDEAVEAGVHTLFFQCGLGHMLGLDVHDMEALGEDYVGYTDSIRRNREFGWRSLRLAKALEPGYVITVEPGIYFIPDLIDRWKAEKKARQFINYEAVEKYKDFGGVRLEDDILITDSGNRPLGKPIPRTIEQVEQACA